MPKLQLEQAVWRISLLGISVSITSNALNDCIDNFFAREILEDFECHECKNQKVWKIPGLVHLPKILMIQLKRFSPVRDQVHKLKKKIEFPFQLSFKEKEYELYATINHHGGAKQGHWCKREGLRFFVYTLTKTSPLPRGEIVDLGKDPDNHEYSGVYYPRRPRQGDRMTTSVGVKYAKQAPIHNMACFVHQ
ncbi:hypothetical protein AVEN_185996-1, partial [Araneus ventricosus]